MVLEWLKGATGVFSAGDRGAARSPAQARPPARRVRIQEDAKAAAAARVTREKEKARKDTPRKKNQSRAPSSRLKDDFVVDKKVLGEGHYGVVRRCSPRADPSAPVRKSQPYGYSRAGSENGNSREWEFPGIPGNSRGTIFHSRGARLGKTGKTRQLQWTR